MAWNVTLKITDCVSGAAIGGVFVSDGTNTYPADPWGQFIAVVQDDEADQWGFQLSHTNYLTKFIDLEQSMAGTTHRVCMNPATGDTGTSDGW